MWAFKNLISIFWITSSSWTVISPYVLQVVTVITVFIIMIKIVFFTITVRSGTRSGRRSGRRPGSGTIFFFVVAATSISAPVPSRRPYDSLVIVDWGCFDDSGHCCYHCCCSCKNYNSHNSSMTAAITNCNMCETSNNTELVCVCVCVCVRVCVVCGVVWSCLLC